MHDNPFGLFNEAEAEKDLGVGEGQLIREHTRKKKATNELDHQLYAIFQAAVRILSQETVRKKLRDGR